MAKNNTYTSTFKLVLDTQGLIQSYQNALKQMQQAGATGKATQSLQEEFNKLQAKIQELQSKGRAGFVDSKGIKNYQKEVQKMLGSATALENEFRRVGITAEQLVANSQRAGQGLQNAFGRLNFTDAEGAMQRIYAATDKQRQLEKELQAELARRAERERELRTVMQNTQQQNNRALQMAFEGRSEAFGNKSFNGYDQNHKAIFNRSPQQAQNYQNLTREIQAAIRAEENEEAVIRRITEYVRDNDLEGTLVNNMDAMLDRVRQLSQYYTQLQQNPAIQQYLTARAEREQIGSYLGTDGQTGNINPQTLQELTAATNSLTNAQDRQNNVLNTAGQNANQTNQSYQHLNSAINSVSNTALNTGASFNQTSEEILESAHKAEQTTHTFDRMKNSLAMFFSITRGYYLVRQQITKTYQDIQQLDKAFASIAMVTDKTVGDMWASYGQYAQMAQQLGQSTQSVIEASALFYQQGLDTNEALQLTTDTMKLATLSGADFSTATQEMTAAIRGFKMEMTDGAHITDVYSTLAANAAASVDQIAQAMSRTSSIAESAGMSFENTSAFLTAMIEATQETATNIGTSLKTIIARFTEVKENTEDLSDVDLEGFDINKVDKALKSVGISLKDSTGQIRNLDDVLVELAAKWDTLDRNTQRYVATTAAGSRQQSRFIALVSNYDRVTELMEIAADSTGKADEQFSKYADTIEFKIKALQTAWEQFRVNLIGADFFKNFLGEVTSIVNKLNNITIGLNFKALNLAGFIASTVIIIKKQILLAIQTGQNFSQLGMALGRQLAIGLKQTTPTIGQNLISEEAFRAQLQGLEQQVATTAQNFRSHFQTVAAQLAGLNNTNIDTITNRLRQFDFTADQSSQSLGNLARELLEMAGVSNPSQQKIDELTQELKGLQGQAAASANAVNQLSQAQTERNTQQQQLIQTQQRLSYVTQGFSMVTMSAVNAISSYASGMMTAEQAAISFLKQMTVSIVNIGINIAAQEALNWVKQKGVASQNLNTASTVANTGANFMNALSIKAVIGAAAGLVAGLLAAVGVFLLINKLVKESAERNDKLGQTYKTLDSEIEGLQKEHDELQKKYDKEKEDVDELSEGYQELISAYKDYNGAVVLAAKQEEDWLQRSQKIAEVYPELISYYDEAGNAIIDVATAWQFCATASQEYYKAQAEAKRADIDLQINELKQLNKEQEKLQTTSINLAKLTTGDLKFQNNMVGFAESMKQAQGIAAPLAVFGGLSEVVAAGVSLATMNDKNVGHLFSESMDDNDLLMIRDALIQQGEAGKWGISEEMSAEEIGKALDKQFEGLTIDKAQEKLDEFTETIENFNTAVVEGQQQFQKQLKKVNQLLLKTVGEAQLANTLANENTSASTQLSLSSLDQQEQNILITYVGKKVELSDEYQNANEEKRTELIKQAGEKELSFETLSGFYEIQSLYNQLQQDVIDLNAFLETVATGNYTKEQKSTLQEIYSDVIDANKMQSKNFANLLGFSEEDLKKSQQSLEATGFLDINKYEGKTKEVLEWYYNLGEEARASFVQGAIKQEQTEKWAGDDQNFAKSYSNIIKSYSQEIQDYLAIQDFAQKDLTGILQTTWIQDLVSNFGLAQDEAEHLIESLRMLAGANSQTFSIGDVDDYSSKITKIREGIEKSSDVLSKMMNSSESLYNLQAGEYEKLEETFETLQEAGLATSETFRSFVNANGQVDVKKIQQYFSTLTDIQSVQQKLAKEGGLVAEEAEKLAPAFAAAAKNLNNLLGLTKSLEEQLDAAGSAIDAYSSAAKESIEEGSVSASSIESLDKALQEMDGDKRASDFIDKNLQLNRKALESYIESYIKAIQLDDTMTQKEKEMATLQANAYLKELRDTTDELAEVTSKVDEAQEKYNDALKDYQDALDDVNDKQQELIEKQEELNKKFEEYYKLLSGDPNYDFSSDALYNYEQRLELINDELEHYKELWEDSTNIDEATNSLKKYLSLSHEQLVVQKAQVDRLQSYAQEYYDNLFNAVYDYEGEFGSLHFDPTDVIRLDENGLIQFNEALARQLGVSDDVIDKWVVDFIDKFNEAQKKIRELSKTISDEEKALREIRKNIVKNYSSQIETVANLLKDQYQDEVDALEEKYEQMKEADDDYLSALEESINKQRELREREQSWEELAQQEKQLALMQRDTSGANAIEVQELQEDIQQTRQELLDQQIDAIIEGLRQLYESQQETREAEIELKEAIVENTEHWNQQAAEKLEGIQSFDDFVNLITLLDPEWQEIAEIQREDYLNGLEEDYQDIITYQSLEAINAASFSGDAITDAINTTQNEVAATQIDIWDDLSGEAQRRFNTISEELTNNFNNAEEEIKQAQQAVADAETALDNALSKLLDCATAANAAAIAYKNAQKEWAEYWATLTNNEVNYDTDDDDGTSIALSMWESYQNLKNTNGAGYEAARLSQNGRTSASPEDKGREATVRQVEKEQEAQKTEHNLAFAAAQNAFSILEPARQNVLDLQSQYDEAVSKNLDPHEEWIAWNHAKEAYNKAIDSIISSYQRRGRGMTWPSLPEDMIPQKFATGGLVKYTGPAWVDGSYDRPEAFLSADDTERIGNAAKILSDLPLLNGDLENLQNITNNTVGDTQIEINLNIESLSSEIDIEDMLSRVREEIVDVANPIGSNVILQQNLF